MSFLHSNPGPAVEETLTLDDAGKVARELSEAQTVSLALGLELKVPLHEVEAIHLDYQRSRDHLLRVIIAFLNRVEPRPTWRIIVEALRSPLVNLPALARRVEATYFPDPTSARNVETTGSYVPSALRVIYLSIDLCVSLSRHRICGQHYL